MSASRPSQPSVSGNDARRSARPRGMRTLAWPSMRGRSPSFSGRRTRRCARERSTLRLSVSGRPHCGREPAPMSRSAEPSASKRRTRTAPGSTRTRASTPHSASSSMARTGGFFSPPGYTRRELFSSALATRRATSNDEPCSLSSSTVTSASTWCAVTLVPSTSSERSASVSATTPNGAWNGPALAVFFIFTSRLASSP